jgi:hypothetical protein
MDERARTDWLIGQKQKKREKHEPDQSRLRLINYSHYQDRNDILPTDILPTARLSVCNSSQT